mgnify:CR=1 FL=1
MKLWIGVLVSLLVATACLVACGDSDDGPGVRNAALLTSDTTEVKVSSGDDSKGDSDYNDAVLSFNTACVLGGDGEIPSVYITFRPLTKGGILSKGLQVRLPSLARARVTRLGSQAFLHDTVYITSEGTAERLCDDPNQALVEESKANRRQILEALESANAKAKGGPENIPLDKLLLPDKETPSDLIWAEESLSGSKSDKDLVELSVYIELLVLGREGESSNDLNARRDAILDELSLRPEPSLLDEGSNQQPTNINTSLCPSRRELMGNSHPHGPYSLHITIFRLGASSGFPQICLLGHDIGLQNTEGEFRPVPRWGARVYCNHPHGSIYIPEGGRCSDLVPE